MMNRRRFVIGSAAGVVSGMVRGGRVAAAETAGALGAATTRSATTRVAADVVPGDVVWHDVREWGIEGKAFADTAGYFDRLPGRAKGVVREAVWGLSRHTSGMMASFEADGGEVYVRYSVLNKELAMPHMPASGVSGVDLYAKMDGGGWRWVGTHQPRAQRIEARLVGGLDVGRRAYRVNLPLYNGVTSMEIGVRKGAKFEGVGPRKERPILFYGTSITQGACASRPGMSFTSILGRRLDRPVLNFGFSGNGTTEVEVARFLAEIDAAVFVVDTVANTPAGVLRERTDAVVRLFKKERPGTPVLLVGGREFAKCRLLAPQVAKGLKEKSAALRAAYDGLVGAGVSGVYYRAGEDLIGADGEGTVDGSHPSDLGMMRYAEALEPELRRVLSA